MKSQRPHVARKGLLTIAVTFVGPLFALSMLHYFEPLLLLTPRSVLRLAYHSDPTPQFPNLALAVDGAASLPSYRAILSTCKRDLHLTQILMICVRRTSRNVKAREVLYKPLQIRIDDGVLRARGAK